MTKELKNQFLKKEGIYFESCIDVTNTMIEVEHSDKLYSVNRKKNIILLVVNLVAKIYFALLLNKPPPKRKTYKINSKKNLLIAERKRNAL